MTTVMKENLVRIIILDISGTYAQIYDQGYFDKKSVEDVQQQYSNQERWHVLILN